MLHWSHQQKLEWVDSEVVSLSTYLGFTMRQRDLPPAAMAMIDSVVAAQALHSAGSSWRMVPAPTAAACANRSLDAVERGTSDTQPNNRNKASQAVIVGAHDLPVELMARLPSLIPDGQQVIDVQRLRKEGAKMIDLRWLFLRHQSREMVYFVDCHRRLIQHKHQLKLHVESTGFESDDGYNDALLFWQPLHLTSVKNEVLDWADSVQVQDRAAVHARMCRVCTGWRSNLTPSLHRYCRAHSTALHGPRNLFDFPHTSNETASVQRVFMAMQIPWAEPHLPAWWPLLGGMPRPLSAEEMQLAVSQANTDTSASHELLIPDRLAASHELLIPDRPTSKSSHPALTSGITLMPDRQPSSNKRQRIELVGDTVVPSRPVLDHRNCTPAMVPRVVPDRGPQQTLSPAFTAPHRNAQLFAHLQKDESPYALCPGQPSRLQNLCVTAQTLLSKSYSLRTCKRDAAAFKKYAALCRSFGTTPWRDDAAANSGADPVGHQREIILFINVLVHFQQTCKPRPNGSNRTTVKPDSAMQYIRAIRRVFKANMIPLLSMTAIIRALHSMNLEFIMQYGPTALSPRRAAPFTNAMLEAMLNCSDCMQLSRGSEVDFSSFEGLNLRTFCALARCTGMRKSELVSNGDTNALRLDNVAYIISGTVVLRPTQSQLESLTLGDYMVLTPPPSKSDPFGVVWGSLPIYVAFRDTNANAARLVAQILKQRQGDLGSSPLLCRTPGSPFTHSFLDRVLKKLLVHVGVSESQARLYSWHSARAYLACALMAADRSPETIQAICRWQSADSLRVYAALNPATYAGHIEAAERATVAGIRGAHIPLIDSIDMAYCMHQQIVVPAASS